jgi:hypothetical protein
MRPLVLALQWLIRLLAVVQLVLGLLFWSGNALSLIPLHMLSGLLLVLGLWIQAGLGARNGAGLGLAGGALVWGLLVVGLGVSQDGLLPGGLHWLIQVTHLLVGIVAVGLAESLAVRGLRRLAAPAPMLAAEAR